MMEGRALLNKNKKPCQSGCILQGARSWRCACEAPDYTCNKLVCKLIAFAWSGVLAHPINSKNDILRNTLFTICEMLLSRDMCTFIGLEGTANHFWLLNRSRISLNSCAAWMQRQNPRNMLGESSICFCLAKEVTQ